MAFLGLDLNLGTLGKQKNNDFGLKEANTNKSLQKAQESVNMYLQGIEPGPERFTRERCATELFSFIL